MSTRSTARANAAMVPPGPLADEGLRRKEWKSWYFYDWANSAYVTTTATVLFGPYLTVIAKAAACPGQDSDLDCATNLSIIGIPVAPGALAAYAVTFTTLFSVFVLPFVGAIADASSNKRGMLGRFAWLGAIAASAMFLVTGDNWQLGVALLFVANLALGCSLVVYDSILCDIAPEDDRDKVSSRGWALGYLGGGLLLVANLALVTILPFGITTGEAVRISLFSAGVWWAAWTLVPYFGLRNRPPLVQEVKEGSLAKRAFGQLFATLKDLPNYPQTMLFLVGYIFYNDGIQTVITSASIFGAEELDLEQGTLITAILLVQFVAFFGALALGRLAGRYGARQVILASLVLWGVVVTGAYFLPVGQALPFFALAVFIGFVLGGSQALSRSLFSLLVPRGKEAEYFSLYQASERGTSWFGTLTFGLVFQFTGSYRNAVFALIAFFIIGIVVLSRVNVRQGIEDAGNRVPAVV